MAITINCPNCRSTVRSPDELVGKKVQCPKCSTIFRVETPNAGIEVVEDEEIEVVDDEPAPPRRPKRRPPPVEAEVVDEGPRRRRPRDEDDEDDQDEERPRRRRRRGGAPHRGGLILGLGIASLVACAPLGIAAWTMGNTDLEAMRRGRMDDTGEGMTKAGRICGMIASILMIVSIGCYGIGFIVLALSGAGNVR